MKGEKKDLQQIEISSSVLEVRLFVFDLVSKREQTSWHHSQTGHMHRRLTSTHVQVINKYISIMLLMHMYAGRHAHIPKHVHNIKDMRTV